MIGLSIPTGQRVGWYHQDDAGEWRLVRELLDGDEPPPLGAGDILMTWNAVHGFVPSSFQPVPPP